MERAMSHTLSSPQRPERNALITWQDDAVDMIEASSGPPLRRIALACVLTMLLGFGGLSLWAALAKVDTAVPAPGVIVSAAKRKTISVLDPGILAELAVHEGERVQAGQLLLRLDDVQARAAREQAKLQFWGATLAAARLAAEAADRRSLVLTPAINAAADTDAGLATLRAATLDLFASRWRSYDESLRVAQQHLAQAQAAAPQLAAQIAGLSTRLGLTRTEQQNVDRLVAQGYETRPRMIGLHLDVADLTAQLGAARAQSVQAEAAIGQATQELTGLVANRHSDIDKDMTDAEAARTDADQRLRAAEDVLSRRRVLAPEDGIVTDIKLFTRGSSINVGQPILDLVPLDNRLLIEANVSPLDIEHVAVGQRVNVRLTAYKSHRVPVLTGHLVYVGADRQMDPSNQPIFLARAELDPGEVNRYPGVVVYAGMPADVLIIAGERSILDYLVSPISDNLSHGMHEE